MMMDALTLHQLVCFEAVVSEGSFQAAAGKLRRSQPTVSASVKNLETQLQLSLLDRSGYRVTLTEAGRSFYERTRVFLHEAQRLRDHATQLAMGEENELSVVIGDISPLPETLGLLRRFFDGCPGTRLHLHFEAISGPWERLFDGEADLIFHHIDKSDPRLEFVDLFTVRIVPVVAPEFPALSDLQIDHPGADARLRAMRDPRHRPPFAAARLFIWSRVRAAGPSAIS